MIDFKILNTVKEDINLYCQVPSGDFSKFVYIQEIIFQTKEQFNNEYPTTEYIKKIEFSITDNVKLQIGGINLSDYGLSPNEPYYVWVKTYYNNGDLDPDKLEYIPDNTPEIYKSHISVSVSLNYDNKYKEIISNIKELQLDCDIPNNLIDTILRYKVVKLCVENNDLDRAVSLYNTYIKPNSDG